MTRVKRGTTANKSRKNVLAQTKGYRFGRSTKERQAYEAIVHAGSHAFAHRRDKKGDYRRLWNVKINAGIRALENVTIPSYSKLIDALKKKSIALNRKMLAELAEFQPEVFAKVIETASAK
ncbi:MAG: 50S ribosomal protein L20 [Candidatus Parcubacteria bacterium]|nr:50S ribosomal protein L20 [Candidatus Parcubacteria bacterium]